MARYMLALPVEVAEWVDIREELPRIQAILAAWADPDEMIFGEPSIELATDSGGST
jgi:hypothetical protein